MRTLLLFGAVLAAVGLAACTGGSPGNANASRSAFVAYDAAAVPAGPVGDLVKYGRALILHTRTHLQPYITANMDCAACHVSGGTKARGGTFVGIAGQFPQWNPRSHRVISLQDRIAECFLYSENGTPPSYTGRAMEAIAAYITYLSRGAKVGAKRDPSTRIAQIHFIKADPRAGAQIYAQRCSMCHGVAGAGSSVFPPLWGPTSFNNGAGMHKLPMMAGFVRYNMPQNAPGTLSDRQAYDVAAFVLSHARPKFQGNRLIGYPPKPAKFY